MILGTSFNIEDAPNGNARLVVQTFVDGHSLGFHTALSGPKADIVAYVAGDMTWEEIEARWHKTKR